MGHVDTIRLSCTPERREGWKEFTLLSKGLESRTKTNLINSI